MIRSIQSTDVKKDEIPEHTELKEFKQLTIDKLAFAYGSKDAEGKDTETFGFGPVDLTVNAGEVVFIIGGNGSGKSTFVKLLTGLYDSDSGGISINGHPINRQELGEYFSVVFSGDYHFKKLFGIPLEGREQEVDGLIDKMRLNDKVSVENQEFSTCLLYTSDAADE